ncbi:hypothetical protein C2G38_2193748 [Gigaspora rosea]|uniref:Uncharacterized protein n=1 Tax=Gigaspora rosea TaxID=44941 RepID=A0A397UXP1_9GLOM|nr:hypothetical protein C2G38_2193748 [Gigaspora rosea]
MKNILRILKVSENKKPINVQTQIELKAYNLNAGLDINLWVESLEDETTWGIVGYNEIYSIFELLDEELQKEVLRAMGHQIL